jgi:asparagine synthase (glutamine-hydrolysing)
MCGILGVLSPRLPENRIIREALELLRHRGPDDEGYLFSNTGNNRHTPASGAGSCSIIRNEQIDISDTDIREYDLVLGHRRLSIIDLSPRGHQPMSYSGGDLWITYNGEIFNYRELRAELASLGYRFHSDTDTEVILASYSEWGTECVTRFNGQWAFCIYDSRKRILFCSRDHFGIKPFYYWFDGKNFAFASEINALLKLPFTDRKLNKPVFSDLLVFYMLGSAEETLYEGIHQLPPSSNIVVDVREMSISCNRYYELPPNDERGNYDHRQALRYADDIRELLIDAVRIRLTSDVPVGSCLSGGLDSSSIVVIINKLLKEGGVSPETVGGIQKTFTISYDDPAVDEKEYADEVIRHTHVDSYFASPDAALLWGELDKFLLHHDGLCSSARIYAWWCVMRLASGHVKVVLNGQGADELFGGYPPRYEPIYLAEALRDMRIIESFEIMSRQGGLYGPGYSLRRAVEAHYYTLVPDNLQIALFKARHRKELGYAARLLGDGCINSAGLKRTVGRTKSLNYRLWRDVTNDYLPQLLCYDDRNASAFSIENRVPFVDHRLIEYVNAIPSVYKLYNGWNKWLLRLAMRDLLPEKILWRRDKLGFPAPEKTWLSHKDSPVPSFMGRYGIGKYGSFTWRLYLAEKLIRELQEKGQ